MNKFIIIDNFSPYLFHLNLIDSDAVKVSRTYAIHLYQLNELFFNKKYGTSKRSKFHYSILEKEGLISIVCT
jgi:hypothetical protein